MNAPWGYRTIQVRAYDRGHESEALKCGRSKGSLSAATLGLWGTLSLRKATSTASFDGRPVTHGFGGA